MKINEEGGWIKLHRKMLDNPIVMKDADHLAVWVFLLLHATHKNYPVLFKGQKIMLKPGQLITGCTYISDTLEISESKVRRILNAFKNDGQIDRQTSTKNSLITVLSWEIYQECDGQSDGQVTDKRRTSDGQVTAYKNERMEECKNERNNYSVSNDTECQTEAVRQVISAWNNTSFAPITKITSASQRGQMLSARLKEYGLEKVLEAIKKADQSSFLKGQNKNGWLCTFDWFVRPNNFLKILEGNYNDRTPATGSKPISPYKITGQSSIVPDKELVQKFLRGEIEV